MRSALFARSRHPNPRHPRWRWRQRQKYGGKVQRPSRLSDGWAPRCSMKAMKATRRSTQQASQSASQRARKSVHWLLRPWWAGAGGPAKGIIQLSSAELGPGRGGAGRARRPAGWAFTSGRPGGRDKCAQRWLLRGRKGGGAAGQNYSPASAAFRGSRAPHRVTPRQCPCWSARHEARPPQKAAVALATRQTIFILKNK